LEGAPIPLDPQAEALLAQVDQARAVLPEAGAALRAALA
jgi:hypothetical protein